MGRYLTPDPQWAGEQVSAFPASWAGRLIAKWQGRHQLDRAGANLELLSHSHSIQAAQKLGVPADANDNEICQAAKDTARDMGRRLDQRRVITEADHGWPWSVDRIEQVQALAAYAEALHWLELRGVTMLKVRGPISAFIKRMTCERWWRRLIRRTHAMATETVARRLGLVHKRAGCYVSDDALNRRRGQQARNGAALESVEAVNEHGQAYTLAELAAKGMANKEIRRHELMTRIAGFELIAKDCGHDAYFVTVTCPSRMHAVRKAGQWHTEPNPKHDGTTPAEAQKYLSKQWGRARAAADRRGLQWYGFRIAEPNHDGTPHWHMLLFFDRQAGNRPAYRVLVRLLRRYFFWNDSPDEKGARRARIDVERIDWTKGSAAGYVAKYVSKNIDGYKVEKDLHGNDCMTASRRVEAWAATWRVRQFQQIGGAPVTTWRELRRVDPGQGGAALAVEEGLQAVNRARQEKHAETEAVKRYSTANGWADYTRLQGGPRIPRRLHRVKVLREQTGELSRYGDLAAPKVVGVTTMDMEPSKPVTIGICSFWTEARRTLVEVESERATWLVQPRGSAKAEGRRALPNGAAVRPWSPVNNCTATRPAVHPVALFGASVQRVKKRGRFVNWAKVDDDSSSRPPASETDGRHQLQPRQERR